SQDIVPKALILVDDNSTDSTISIINTFCHRYDWIKYYYHSSHDMKSQGAKVIRAFNYGLSKVSLKKVDVVTKMDADLEVPSNYFTEIKKTFTDPKIGLSGGYILEQRKNKWSKINQADYHIRGALKSYRVNCFDQINGFEDTLGWDGLDEMKAFYFGWNSKIINVGVKHYRPASTDYNIPKLYYELGSANYKNGGNLFLAIVRFFVKCKTKPVIYAGFAYLAGYLSLYLRNKEKNVDDKLAGFINKFHINRLLLRR
ncbi:MAG: glycosyltransferase family 2 protein, partial [Balneolales bacterium]